MKEEYQRTSVLAQMEWQYVSSEYGAQVTCPAASKEARHEQFKKYSRGEWSYPDRVAS